MTRARFASFSLGCFPSLGSLTALPSVFALLARLPFLGRGSIITPPHLFLGTAATKLTDYGRK
jgi:hypothetical protein